MDEVLKPRPSTTPPALIAAIPENTPGPNAALGDWEDRDEGENKRGSQPPTGRKRQRDRDDNWWTSWGSKVRQRRAQESREIKDRLFSVLKRLVPKWVVHSYMFECYCFCRSYFVLKILTKINIYWQQLILFPFLLFLLFFVFFYKYK